jgi:protein SCO1
MKMFLSIAVLTMCLSAASVSAAETKRAASESLYALPVQLVDQHGQAKALDLYRGHPVIVTMFYGSCPNACPLLIESIRATERALPPTVRSDVRVLLISIDPKRDTPAALAVIVKTRHVDTQRWTLARTDADDVRLLAAALGVQYRHLPNDEFNHTSVLTVLDRNGMLREKTELLGKADAEFVAAVTATAQELAR